MKTQIELVPYVLVTLTEQEARQIVAAIRGLMRVSPVHPALAELYHDLNSRFQSIDEEMEEKETPF